MSMKERLEIHRQIERENDQKLKEWKEEQSNEHYAHKSAS